MTKNIVRTQTEMFKTGAVVRGPVVDVYLDPPRNAAWWPHLPRFTWLTAEAGTKQALRFDEGGFFFTFAALGTEINGHANGDIDLLLQTRPAAELFKDDLAGLALISVERLQHALVQACWATLAVYDVDVSTGKLEFDAGFDLEYIEAEETGSI